MPLDTPQFAIEAHDLHKTYAAQGSAPPKTALNGVSLQIPAGSVFGLLGANGAGKSTFINILAGLVVKSAGSVKIWGFDQDVNPRMSRASIGVVPQELILDPFFTPREALEIQAGLYGVPKSERRTMELLAALNLDDKADAYARSLSGGMRRRLLIGKALCHSPPVLILDEPTAGVDIELRKQMWTYVRELNERGVTIVLTTHYLEEAEEMCDRIAIIDSGKVVACEDKAVLMQRVDSKSVAIWPEEALSAVPDGLHSHGDLDVRLREDGALVITFPKSHMRLGQILAAVQTAGITVKDLTTEEADLEDVFVAMTGGGNK